MASSHFFCFLLYQPVMRPLAAFHSIPHPVQHDNADCCEQYPHNHELRANLPHDVQRHIGVVPHAHAEPYIYNRTGNELHHRDSQSAHDGLYQQRRLPWKLTAEPLQRHGKNDGQRQHCPANCLWIAVTDLLRKTIPTEAHLEAIYWPVFGCT